MVLFQNMSRSILSSKTTYSRNILGTTSNLVISPKNLINSSKYTVMPAGTLVIPQLGENQMNIVRKIHELYTLMLASRKYEKIPSDYDQYVDLLTQLTDITVTGSALQLMMNIVEKTLIGCMNVTSVYEINLYNELQVLLLNTRINDILTDKNKKHVVGDSDNVSGHIAVQKTFTLSKIYSYYIYLYGMPEFGVGFDVDKLKFLRNSLDLIEKHELVLKPVEPFTTEGDYLSLRAHPQTAIAAFDVSNSLEVAIPAHIFNEKIGIKKVGGLVMNYGETAPFYDSSNHQLLDDSLTLSATEFIQHLKLPGNVVSIRSFTTVYTDFSHYVAQYFGFTTSEAKGFWGFGTLFSGILTFPEVQGNRGLFDSTAFVRMIEDGDRQTLTGHIRVDNVTQLLRYAIYSNVFGNRGPDSPYRASNVTNGDWYSVMDGFFPNDLFFIPQGGCQITLNVGVTQDITTQQPPHVNYLTNSTVRSVNIGPADTKNQNTVYRSIRTVTTSQIKYVVQSSVLIRLTETLGVDM
jgi:hypothetical protein